MRGERKGGMWIHINKENEKKDKRRGTRKRNETIVRK